MLVVCVVMVLDGIDVVVVEDVECGCVVLLCVVLVWVYLWVIGIVLMLGD